MHGIQKVKTSFVYYWISLVRDIIFKLRPNKVLVVCQLLQGSSLYLGKVQ